MDVREKIYSEVDHMNPGELNRIYDYIKTIKGEEEKLPPDETSIPRTDIDEVAGCLHYEGPAKTLEEMNQAISEGIKRQWSN